MSRPPRHRPEDFRIDVAGPGDDDDVRRVLRANPMPGAFALAFTREPSFLHAAGIEGETSETILARDLASGQVVGTGSRAVAAAFVDGQRARLGYLSQLRVDEPYRGMGLLEAGFAKIRELHDADPVPLYATTIIEGNARAFRALTRGRFGLPTYREREVMTTLALLVPRLRRRPPRADSRFEVIAARDEHVGDIAACLQRCYRRYQVAPLWTAADLLDPARTRDLAPSDFTVALRGGRVAGCVAVWDQRRFKQTVVHGYSGALRHARPLVNLLAPFLSVPHLPPVGAELPHAYLSHLAVADEDPELLVALIRAALHRVSGRGYAYLTLALADRHPLLGTLRRRFRHMAYRAVLFLVHFEDGADAMARLDDRVPHLELAIL